MQALHTVILQAGFSDCPLKRQAGPDLNGSLMIYRCPARLPYSLPHTTAGRDGVCGGVCRLGRGDWSDGPLELGRELRRPKHILPEIRTVPTYGPKTISSFCFFAVLRFLLLFIPLRTSRPNITMMKSSLAILMLCMVTESSAFALGARASLFMTQHPKACCGIHRSISSRRNDHPRLQMSTKPVSGPCRFEPFASA